MQNNRLTGACATHFWSLLNFASSHEDTKKEADVTEVMDHTIELARSVYFINDDRAAVKKEINLKFGSDLVEEKEYVDYK